MLFGLVGKKLSHSFSAMLFNEKFFPTHEYKLFEIENANEIRHLIKKEKCIAGLNVTIPYKEEIIGFLDYIDNVAAEIGSVNTILIEKNTIKGFNTDYIGFERAYNKELKKNHKLALILGTGGSSKAVAYVFKKYNIPYFFVSRSKRNERTVLYEDVYNLTDLCSIIINTTPIGMYPEIDQQPSITYEVFKNKPVVIDIIYNPEKTMFLKNAESYGCNIYNGLSMLKEQAYESWKLWNLV